MKASVRRFGRDQSGQDVIEYGLLVGVLTAVSVLTIKSLGSMVLNLYSGLQINL